MTVLRSAVLTVAVVLCVSACIGSPATTSDLQVSVQTLTEAEGIELAARIADARDCVPTSLEEIGDTIELVCSRGIAFGTAKETLNIYCDDSRGWLVNSGPFARIGDMPATDPLVDCHMSQDPVG